MLRELHDLNLNQILFASLDDSGSASGLDFPLVSRVEIRRSAVFRWAGTTGRFSPSDTLQRKQSGLERGLSPGRPGCGTCSHCSSAGRALVQAMSAPSTASGWGAELSPLFRYVQVGCRVGCFISKSGCACMEISFFF